jgi:hypothetical protein
MGRFGYMFLYMSLVKIRINRTKTGQHLSLTNVNFDQGNGKVRLGKVRLGKVRLGKFRLGKVRLGKVRLG